MHKSKGLSRRQQQSATLQARYFNAQDDPLSVNKYAPTLHNTSRPAPQHLPIPIINATNQHQIVPPQDIIDDGNKREIDGFYLLEVSGTSFPEDLQHIVLSDRKLKTVVDEDLTYFSELLYMDISENFLPLFPFGALPKLRELRIACNRITKLEELFGFTQLLYLDMSYNQLHFQSIEYLYDLPLLKELDLSGNALRNLPADLFRFESLEKLILQYNKFDDNSLFQSFGTMPALRYLDVSNNYFSAFPTEGMEDAYKFLDTMDISFNFFGNEQDILGIVFLNRLETLLLYGNPVLGPTGEDPMFIYIEDVVDQANDHRDKIESTISYIDFVTEIPKKRILKKGEPLGRLAMYRDFSIVQVDSRISSHSNREWRRKGIQTIFGEMMAGRRNNNMNSAATLPPATAATTTVPDYTFITNSIATSNNFTAYQKYQQQQAQLNGGGGSAASLIANAGGTNSALNEVNRNAIADAVMRKVVTEMELTGEEDLQLFQSYAKLPPTVVEQELRRALAEDNDEEGNDGNRHHQHSHEKGRGGLLSSLQHPSVLSGESSIFLHGPSSTAPTSFLGNSALSVHSSSSSHNNNKANANHLHAMHLQENSLNSGPNSPLTHLRQSIAIQPPPSVSTAQIPRDHLPEHLFQPSNIIHPLPTQLSIAAQPVALKTAMKALQRALDQPLTNYDAVPSRWSVNEHDYGRHTVTTKLRQQPRIPLTTTMTIGGGNTNSNKNATGTDTRPGTNNTTNHQNVNNNSNNLNNSMRRRNQLASAGQRGLTEPVQLKKLREEARDRTISQLDMVLQSLNDSTQRITTFPRPDINNNTDDANDNEDNEEDDRSKHQKKNKEDLQNIAFVRQSMDKMRYFARPQSGVNNMMNMVKDILDEFHN